MQDQYSPRSPKRKIAGNILAGAFLLVIGTVLLLRQLDFYFPAWFFRWPMILIVVGLFMGIYNQFRDIGWLIICGVGLFFLAPSIWPNIKVRPFIVPAIIIAVGLILIFRRNVFRMFRRNEAPPEPAGPFYQQEPSAEQPADANYQIDYLDMVSVFGGIKKNVLSKRFRGGEIVAVFGGAEVNLMQADFQNTVVIEVVQIFGGTTLYVPRNWQIRSELAAVFGGIEDKRRDIVYENPERVLVLEGFSMFGGIEIKSR
jgi:predicted membrane protein